MKEHTLDLKNETSLIPAPRLAFWLWLLGMVLAGAGIYLLTLNWSTPVPPRWGYRGFQTFNSIPGVTVGALIASRRPRSPIGWILIASGLLGVLTGLGEEFATYALLTRPGFISGVEAIATISNFLWIPGMGLIGIHVFLLFPDGRFLSNRWRIVAWLGSAWMILATIRFWVEPGPLFNLSFAVNPFGMEALAGLQAWSPLSLWVTMGIGLILMLVSAYSLILRYRQSGSQVRQQLKWIAYTAPWMPLSMVFGQFQGFIPDLLVFITTSGLIAAIGIAILQYHLYDIDLLINRTLVYGGLTVIIAGAYVLLVGSTGIVLQRNSRMAGLLLTGLLMVIGLRPMRTVVQSGVDRVIHGKRPLISHTTPVDVAPGRLSENWLKVARAGWITLAILALGFLLTSLPGYASNFGEQLAHVPAGNPTQTTKIFAVANRFASLGSALLSLGLSWMLYRSKFKESAATALAFYLLLYGILMAGPMERWGAYWVGNSDFALLLQSILLATPTVALLAIFPNGSFVPSWMRWVVLLSIPWSISLLFLPLPTGENVAQEPFTFTLLAIWYTLIILVSGYAQVYRYRHVSTIEERQQTKWVVFGFALWAIYIFISTPPYFYLTNLPLGAPVPWWAEASVLGWSLSLGIVPVTLTIALTRHRLWNVDLVINRTLVYASLTAGVIALYVLIVGGLGLLFRSSNSLLVPLLATGLAAVLFQPLRQRLQAAVNRMMYGARDEPAIALTRLSQQLEETDPTENTLYRIVETVALTLKLPYAAIQLEPEQEPAASFGIPNENPRIFPLTYQGIVAGQMLVAGRPPDGELTPKDVQLLEDIARQAGVVAHNVRLTSDLRLSRQKIITTREEERRRLRRDLHDGLGPTLASHMLKIGSARALLEHDPETADRLLEELETNIESTLADVRRLVYNLRPPSLDQWGLIGAIRSYATGLNGQTAAEPQGIDISLDAPDDLPPLPAAVEVAAYYIVVEGLTNVFHHAHAERCRVKITLVKGDEEQENGRLCLSIEDDGQGLPQVVQAGVGLASMKERAEELGGSWSIQSLKDGGTRVTATLPLGE